MADIGSLRGTEKALRTTEVYGVANNQASWIGKEFLTQRGGEEEILPSPQPQVSSLHFPPISSDEVTQSPISNPQSLKAFCG